MSKLHEKMFLAQATLEVWIDSGKADFDGSVVTLKKHRRKYALEPAVQFVSAIDGGDPTLIGKVIGEEMIAELGGELLGDSLVFGEHAFQVRSGYIATLNGGVR